VETKERRCTIEGKGGNKRMDTMTLTQALTYEIERMETQKENQ